MEGMYLAASIATFAGALLNLGTLYLLRRHRLLLEANERARQALHTGRTA